MFCVTRKYDYSKFQAFKQLKKSQNINFIFKNKLLNSFNITYK